MAINTYFQNIADAIREKTGETSLITPGDMPDEIRGISGGGVEPLTPLHFDLNNGTYVAGNGSLYGQYNSIAFLDVYDLGTDTSGNNNVLIIGLGATVGNRFRCTMLNNDPASFTVPPTMTTATLLSNQIYGVTIIDNPAAYVSVRQENLTRFLVIGKSNQVGGENIKTYVYRWGDLSNGSN